ncbi:hypothetical protein ACLKA6_015861 [Drosophila palustris]
MLTKTQRRRNQRKKQKERILQLAADLVETVEDVVKAAKKSAKRKKRRNQRKRAKVEKSLEKHVETLTGKSVSSFDTQDSFFDSSEILSPDELPVNENEHKYHGSQWAFDDALNKERQPWSMPCQSVALQLEERIEIQYQSVQWSADKGDAMPAQSSGPWMQPPPSLPPVHQQLHQYINLRHETHEHAYYMDDNNNTYYEQQQEQQCDLQFFQNCWEEPNSAAVQETFEFQQQQYQALWYKKA